MSDARTLTGRPPSASHLTLSQIMDQHHTNLMGTVHGGRILNLIDSVAGVVAVDDHGHPRAVPPLRPETDDDRRRYREAHIRREHRLALRRALLDGGDEA
ncbi:hypothetical protein [Micromonospora maritima]|uniref:Uncharacterized protein n=1 Tax=Micromonospora maritima TaxID=986711 RepID=A0ABW7ZIS8_9ACTN